MHVSRVAPIFIILISAFALSLIISVMLPNISTYFRPLTGSILPASTNYQSLVCGAGSNAGSNGTCPVPGSECSNSTCVYSSCDCIVNENQNVPSGTTYTFNNFKINAGRIVNIQTAATGNDVDGGNAGRGGSGGSGSSVCCFTSNPNYFAYTGEGGGGGPGAGGGGGTVYGGSNSGSGGGGQSGGYIGIGTASSGGTTVGGSGSVINGGAGGGGIEIIAGNITIDGEMHADGGAGASGTGGGGGGLIILSADSISVSGSVTANGGDAGQVSSCGSGGGGGGYIKIISANAVNIKQGALSVAAGARGASTCSAYGCLGCGPVASPAGIAGAGNIDYVTSLAENCTNGIDDNGNGLIDCADPACVSTACKLSGCTAASCGSYSCNSIGFWDNALSSNAQKCCPNANYCVIINGTSGLTDCKTEAFQTSDNYGCFRGKWSLCNAAGVEGTQTNSAGNKYYCCPSGSSYVWRSAPCGVATTTTSTTSSTTTTTTSSTTTTTTETPAGTFSYSNFACSSITTGWQCNITYSNNLGENAIVVFLVSNTDEHVVSSTSPVATQTASNVGTIFQCSSLASGTYHVDWRAYRQSDTNFANAVASSKLIERQLIVC